MGDIPAEMRAGVKAQLLAFLLYSTLASLQQLAAAFGGDSLDDYGSEEPAAQLLPGPHAALRCLFWLDAGESPTFDSPGTAFSAFDLNCILRPALTSMQHRPLLVFSACSAQEQLMQTIASD